MGRYPSKVFSFLKNEAVLDISMYGALRSDWSKGSEQGALLDAVKACDPTDSIKVRINSEGGNMFAGIAILNILDSHPGEVTCVVEGLAASAASIVAMAGKTVMRNGAMMMIHNPWAIVAGDADDMRSAADMLDKSKASLVAIYEEKTGKSENELKKLLSAETWMTADEAVEAGFADEKCDEDEDDDDDCMNVVSENKKRVRINNISFPRSHVPPQILAMVRDNQTQEPSMKSVLAALSLKDNANEAEALTVVTKINDERKQLLALTGKDNAAEALGVLAGWKQSASEVTELKAQAKAKADEQEARDFDSEIANAKKASVLAASDEHKRNKHALSFKGKPEALSSLKGYLGALDPLVISASAPVVTTEPNTGVVTGVVALSDEEKRIAQKLNVSNEAMLKNKERLLLKASQAPSRNVVDDDEDAA